MPLLFVQLAYYKVFYPATILMAWFWLAIIVLLIPAYYGVYAYAWGICTTSRASMAGWRVAAGWCAAVFFIAIGFHVRQRAEPDGSRRALARAVEGPQRGRGGDWARP